MNFLERLRAMFGLSESAELLANAELRRRVETQDDLRDEYLGDVDAQTMRARSFAAELEARAKAV